MKKIIGLVALLVFSLATTFAIGKESKEASPASLVAIEAKLTDLTQAVEKTEVVKASTLEKIEKQLSELDAQKNERTKIEIERDRKSIEFWFALLGLLVTVIAFGGGFIPYLMGRKDKELLAIEIASVKNVKSEVDKDLKEVKKIKDEIQQTNKLLNTELEEARRLVTSIEDKHIEAAQSLNAIQKFTSNPDSKPADLAAVQAEIKEVNKNPKQYTDADKLRTKAVAASLVENPTQENALEAFELWKAVTLINPGDASAQFNSGYWAAELAEKKALPGRSYWLKQAGEKFVMALQIKPDMYEAASNWGVVLSKEASELVKTDPLAGQDIWKQAVSLSEKHLKAAPAIIAYNLACFYSALNEAVKSLEVLEIARQHDSFPRSHLEIDKDLENLRSTDIYKAWYAKHFGNNKAEPA